MSRRTYRKRRANPARAVRPTAIESAPLSHDRKRRESAARSEAEPSGGGWRKPPCAGTRSNGLHFECTQCGECCMDRGEYAHVYVNEAENKALAAFMGLSVRAFKRRYTFVDEDGWRQLSFTGESCIFLDPATNLCRVHPARPIQCRTFPFWQEFVVDGEWSEEVRSLCEGIGRGPLYSIEEAEDRMFEMDQSDQD